MVACWKRLDLCERVRDSSESGSLQAFRRKERGGLAQDRIARRLSRLDPVQVVAGASDMGYAPCFNLFSSDRVQADLVSLGYPDFPLRGVVFIGCANDV